MTIESGGTTSGIGLASASLSANSETTTTSHSSSKRKSIFFPLLVDQSLVSLADSSLGSSASSTGIGGGNASSIEANYNKALLKRITDMLEPLDERALLVSKYLVYSLKHFTRFIKVNKAS